MDLSGPLEVFFLRNAVAEPWRHTLNPSQPRMKQRPAFASRAALRLANGHPTNHWINVLYHTSPLYPPPPPPPPPLPSQAPFVHHASPGDLWWAMSKTAPYVHQVCLLPENTHTSHFFAMEILKPPPVLARGALEHPCYTLRPEDSRPGLARVYNFALRAGESTGFHTWDFCGMVLCLSCSDIEAAGGGGGPEDRDNPFAGGELSRVGGWKWVEGPVPVTVTNNGDHTYEAIVVEWLGPGLPAEGTSRL